jgi:hypothetical protein
MRNKPVFAMQTVLVLRPANFGWGGPYTTPGVRLYLVCLLIAGI